MKCKYCGAQGVVRYGRFRGVQRWWCKDCRRKFTHPESAPGMIAPVEIVSLAMGMYYEGKSLREVRKYLSEHHNYWIAESTLYEWVIRFSRMAVDRSAQFKPIVGDNWALCERAVSIGMKEMVFLDILDTKTSVLLATHVSECNIPQDALDMYARAIVRCQKQPSVLMLDDPLTCGDYPPSPAWGNPMGIGSFMDGRTSTPVENFRLVLQSRDRLLRRLRKPETIRLLVDGWQVRYNFFMPCQSLGGRTPAEAAGMGFDLDWLEPVTASGIHPGGEQWNGENRGEILGRIVWKSHSAQSLGSETKEDWGIWQRYLQTLSYKEAAPVAGQT
ncbi:MAG: hypothetical protein PHV74_07100 [Dehalococcoidia bacterium]|nr:hypothetical protein [Dehalococcoidia bacterium]